MGFRKGSDGKDLRYTAQDGRKIYPYMRVLIRTKQKNDFYEDFHHGAQ